MHPLLQEIMFDCDRDCAIVWRFFMFLIAKTKKLLNFFSIILGYDEKHNAKRNARSRKAGIHIDGW